MHLAVQSSSADVEGQRTGTVLSHIRDMETIMAMRQVRMTSLVAAAAVVSILGIGSRAMAASPALTLNITADDYFNVYLSSSDDVLGTQDGISFVSHGASDQATQVPARYTPDGQELQGTHSSWTKTYTYTLDLTGKETTQYLHIVAANNESDVNHTRSQNAAGVTAELRLSDATFTVGNGQSYLVTGAAGWRAIESPTYSAVTTNPGGTGADWWIAPVSAPVNTSGGGWPTIFSDAKWVWTTDNMINPNLADSKLSFFSTTIEYSAVPEATTMLLGAVAVMPILMQRRRQRGAASQA